MNENIVGSLLGAVIGNLIVLTWAMWPLIKEVARHGWRNDR